MKCIVPSSFRAVLVYAVSLLAVGLAIASGPSVAEAHGHSHGDGKTCPHSHGRHSHSHSHGDGHGHSHRHAPTHGKPLAKTRKQNEKVESVSGRQRKEETVADAGPSSSDSNMAAGCASTSDTSITCKGQTQATAPSPGEERGHDANSKNGNKPSDNEGFGLPAGHPPIQPGSTDNSGGGGGGASSCPYAKMHSTLSGLGSLVVGRGSGIGVETSSTFGTDARKDGDGDGFSHHHKRSFFSIAMEAACASLATSLLPIIVILICPLNWRALRLFVAFASGALIADVFTHQLPSFIVSGHGHSHGGHDHDHHGHGHDPEGHSPASRGGGGGGGIGSIGMHSVVNLVNTPLFRCAVAIVVTYLIDGLVYSRMMGQAKAREKQEATLKKHLMKREHKSNGTNNKKGTTDAQYEDEEEKAGKKIGNKNAQKNTKKVAAHAHGHSHGGASPYSPPEETESGEDEHSDHSDSKDEDTGVRNQSSRSTAQETIERSADSSSSSTFVSHHSASAAIVDLFADTLHNFTDGLTLGASFLKGPKVGWNTTLLVLLHEVPHELGDGALLVRGGWTRWEAAKVQVWTGFGNLLGTMVIIFLNPDQKKIDAWVTPIVAGSFLYVALTGMLGELKEVPPLTVANVVQLIGEALMFLAGLAFLEIVVHSGMH